MFSRPVTNIISRSNPRPNPIMKQDGVQAVRYEKRQVGMEEEEKMETRQVSKVVD